MQAYVDTSYVAAIGLGDAGARALRDRLEKFEKRFSSNLLEVEIRSIWIRENRPRGLLQLDSIEWVLPPRPLHEEIVRACEFGHVRGADLWHIACALYLSPQASELTFLTVDARQGEVAERLGFRI